MISPVQHPLAFHATTSAHLEKRQSFIWDKERKALFTSACFALIYLNGGKVELKKERVIYGNVKNVFCPQAIEHILQRGNFPEFKNLSKKAVRSRLSHLRDNSKKRGSTLEKELLKQYQDLEAATIVNDMQERSSELLEELNKFGIQPGEYDQWLSIGSRFKWDEGRKEIFISACLALIYLNGGRIDLATERVSQGEQTSVLSPKAIEHILQRGNFPEFKTLPKNVVKHHLDHLRRDSKKMGSTLEEELLEQYKDLQAKTIVNDMEEESSELLEELNKFGIQPEEYDQWVPIGSCFKWDEERKALFNSACFALIYLNGGEVALKKERVAPANLKSALSAKAIEHILQRGDFPQFKTIPKGAVLHYLGWLREKSGKTGTTLEEEILEQYRDLEATTIVNDAGEEIPAILHELSKVGVYLTEDGEAIESSSRKNPRKREAEEFPDAEAEPQQKRANYSTEAPFQVNQLTNLRKAIAGIWSEITDQ